MKPIYFPEQTHLIAEHQDEYQTLPAYIGEDQTISCWKLSLRERLKVLFTGKMWLLQLSFGGPLQPQLPQVEYPFRAKT